MTKYADIQEKICLQNAHPYKTNNPFPWNESPFSIHSFLAATKNIGLLMLVSKLLPHHDKPTSVPIKKTNRYRMALQLLSNSQRNIIAIHPALNDDPLTFVSHLLDKAKQLSTHANENHKVYPHARHLVDTIEALPKTDSDNTLPLLEKDWTDFTFHYFHEELNQLLKT